jgi:hypothetical protein
MTNPKLTRCAFQFIADTIRTIDFDTLNDRDRVIAEFSSALHSTNSNFDSGRFERACECITPDAGAIPSAASARRKSA